MTKMKSLKTLTGMVILIVVALFWNACKKETSQQSPNIQSPNNQESQNVKAFGAVKDDPEAISKVPLLMSAEYKANGASYQLDDPFAERGKPIHGGGGGTGDVTPPTVIITSPANGATVTGTTTVQVSATDNIGVSKVSFYVDGTLKSSLTASPYVFTWDASTVVNGTHTLVATGWDAAGNAASSSITVGVNVTIVVQPPPPGPLPTSYQLNMPPIGYQGSEGCCVTFAVVYEMRSGEQYYRTGASSYSQSTNIFSPEYVYDQTKASTSCSSGSSLINTLNFLYSNGVCTWASMPYSDQDGCSWVPTSSQTSEASNYRLKSYKQVLSSDQTGIKTLLSQGHPLSFTFTVDANFYTAGPGYIWNSYSSTIYGPHAITLCGYDDSKKAYRAVNHWGTTWGDAGYIWIDYNFFTSVTGSVYTITI